MLCLGAMSGLTICPTPVMASVTQAKTIKVSSLVVDEQGNPLIGATVKVKGSNKGAVTDLDGRFQLEAPSQAVLLISYVGYKDREVAVEAVLKSSKFS